MNAHYEWYTACCWFPSSSNILDTSTHSSDKSCLKVAELHFVSIDTFTLQCMYIEDTCIKWQHCIFNMWLMPGNPLLRSCHNWVDKTSVLSKKRSLIQQSGRSICALGQDIFFLIAWSGLPVHHVRRPEKVCLHYILPWLALRRTGFTSYMKMCQTVELTSLVE